RSIPVDDRRVIDVRNAGDIHGRIGNVHVIHVATTHPITRNEYLARSQWKPSNANARREAESIPAAHERHQSGSPHRTDNHRSRHPEPAAVHISPAAIMERCEAPGLVFHPGPAPASNEDPVAATIRSPSYGNAARAPARAIAGN